MTIEIPEQVKDFNFVLLGGDDGKKPFEKGWQTKIRRISDPVLKKHLEDGNNYGIRCGSTSPVIIDSNSYSLIGVDFDKAEFQAEILPKLPKTFAVKTGGKGLLHLYFASDNDKSFKIFNEKMETLADIQGEGKQLVGPGSINPKTRRAYEVFDTSPVAFVPYAELEALLRPYDKSPKKAEKPKRQFTPKGTDCSVTEKMVGSVSMDTVLKEAGIDTSRNPTACFAHASSGGKCLGWNDTTAHCFHCDKSWNKFSLIREAKNLTDKTTFDWFADKSGMTEELSKSRKEYAKQNDEGCVNTNDYEIMSRRGQIEAFWQLHPFYYDKSKIFWLWDRENFKWVISDEVDFCNLIFKALHVDTINKEVKSEVIEAFKQVGRLHKPKDVEKSWIQYKDKIYDVKTGAITAATPDYFVCNPIPWKVGTSEDTPTIDKLFNDWTKGQDPKWKDTLYEITAYNTSSDKFMQRIMAFVGGGSNGKGTYIKLNYRFLGAENCVSSEVKSISEDKFEPAVLYKKLLCVMGEVSHDDLKNTNQLKKLGGEDKMSFQFKGKTPFTEENTATCICLTNSMPITPDKTQGFYRKWLIVDFLNQFKAIDKNIIDSIPAEEFENLACKCLRILKELYVKPHFTNEGDFDERAKRYEERSNPVMRFVEKQCVEEEGQMTPLRDFSVACNEYLKQNHLRIMNSKQISKVLRDEGFIVGPRKVNDASVVVIVNLSINTINTIKTIQNPNRLLHGKSISFLDSIDSNDSNLGDKKLTDFPPKTDLGLLSLKKANLSSTTFFPTKTEQFMIFVDKNPQEVKLEQGKVYNKGILGDDADNILQILLLDNVIKLVENQEAIAEEVVEGGIENE